MNTVAQFLPCLLGLLPGDLKHDGWRAVNVNERPVQLLLQLKLALGPRNVDILHDRDASARPIAPLPSTLVAVAVYCHGRACSCTHSANGSTGRRWNTGGARKC
jgi:hypothetical protein